MTSKKIYHNASPNVVHDFKSPSLQDVQAKGVPVATRREQKVVYAIYKGGSVKRFSILYALMRKGYVEFQTGQFSLSYTGNLLGRYLASVADKKKRRIGGSGRNRPDASS